jgi:FkbH-like protein
LKKHPQMVLREDAFTVMKINWDAKTESILQISKDLNIGLDSIVFIDDNPFEREAVKSALPLVEVPNFPGDTTTLNEFISEIYYDRFLCLALTEEDKFKTEMYRQNFARDSGMVNALSLDDYLCTLKTRVTIWKAKPEDVTRIAQLTQKTNQFNLTTKRYNESDIQRLFNSNEHYIFVASVEDRFGDNGKTVLAIVKRISAETAEIDTFLMSCRVMGRFIEDLVITFIEDYLYREGCKNIIAYYHPTDKNIPVEWLFERLGYNCIEQMEDGKRKYINNLIPTKCGERKLIGELKHLEQV